MPQLWNLRLQPDARQEFRDATTVHGGTRTTLSGMVVPWGQEFVRMGGVRFTFVKDSVRLPDDLSTVKLLVQHDDERPVGYATEAESTDEGLRMTFALPTDHARSADLLAEVEANLRDGFSVGVEPDQAVIDAAWNIWLDGEQDEPINMTGDLREVSSVSIPQFNSARAENRRTPVLTLSAGNNENGATTVETTTPEVPTVDLSALATREDMAALESRLSALAPTAPAQTLSVRDAFVAQLTASQERRQVLALADVVSSGNAGVLPPSWSSEVRNYVDAQRYMFGMLGSIGFPTTGYTLTIPKVTQQAKVGPRGTEKTEVPSQAVTTSSDTYTAAWFAGAVDIALELIWQSDPSVYGIVVESILSDYAVVTDQAMTVSVETSATATGAALDFTDWGTVSAQLMSAAEQIRAATGVWGDRVSMTTASWSALIGLMDADGRRVFAPGGATNSDGTAALLSRSINVGGILCAHNPRATADVQFNTKAARAGEKPPTTLTGDNVALMGRDLGVIGATLYVPAYAAGILAHKPAARAK